MSFNNFCYATLHLQALEMEKKSKKHFNYNKILVGWIIYKLHD